MDVLTVFLWIIAGLVVAFAIYVTVATLMLAAALRIARAEEEIPRSFGCRDGRHRACPTCSCRCHP